MRTPTIFSDEPERLALPRDLVAHDLPEPRLMDLDPDGVVVFASTLTSADRIRDVAFVAREHHIPAVLVRRLDGGAWPALPADVVVDVEPADWSAVAVLIALTLGVRRRVKPYARSRHPSRVRWLRGDPRPGPTVAGLCRALGRSPTTAIRLSVVVPATEDAWRRAASDLPWQVVDIAAADDGRDYADVLAFEVCDDEPDTRQRHPLVIEELERDARGFEADVVEPVMPAEIAKRVAELHLSHRVWGVSLSMIHAVVDAMCDPEALDWDEARLALANRIVDETLYLLGHPHDVDDPMFASVLRDASASVRARCLGLPEPEPDEPF